MLGVADAVRAAGIACFGPTKDAARIEGSKSFAKDVMSAAGVRTATKRDRRQPGPPRLRAGSLRPRRWRSGMGGQGRRPRRRQGRGGDDRPGRRESARGQPARRRASGAARVVPRRSRGVAVLCRRRRDGGASAGRAGLQEGRRRRHRAEHRRHGRLRAAGVAAGRGGQPDRQRHRETRCRRAGQAGSSFSGLLYAGLAITSTGPCGRRIQLPLRRSGDPVGARAARLAARPVASCRGHRQPGRAAAVAVARRRGGDRRAGRRELPGPAAGSAT